MDDIIKINLELSVEECITMKNGLQFIISSEWKVMNQAVQDFKTEEHYLTIIHTAKRYYDAIILEDKIATALALACGYIEDKHEGK